MNTTLLAAIAAKRFSAGKRSLKAWAVDVSFTPTSDTPPAEVSSAVSIFRKSGMALRSAFVECGHGQQVAVAGFDERTPRSV
jgi:hypothetical protein